VTADETGMAIVSLWPNEAGMCLMSLLTMSFNW